MNRAKLAVARLGSKINLASIAVPDLAANHIQLIENTSPKEFMPPQPPKNTYGFNPYGVGGSTSFNGKRCEINIDLVGREIEGFDKYVWEEMRQVESLNSIIDFAIDLTINGELNYYKDRFQFDSEFHKAIKVNNRAYYNTTDIVNRFEYIKTPLTFFTLHMWQLLSQMTIDGTYAFNEVEIFKGIARNYPKEPSSKMIDDMNFAIAKGIDDSTFSIKNLPLYTEVIDFNGLDIGQVRKRLLSKEPMIYINTMDQQMGERNTVLMLKFGFKHVVFVSMFSRQGYQLCRINQQNYKFKSLKKDLNR